MQRRTLMLWCLHSVRDVHYLRFHAFNVTFLQLLNLEMRSVRDVHQLRFHAFIVTCSAAAESGDAQRA